MNIQNLRIEANPNVPGDWFIFGDIYDTDGNLVGTYGPDGTSVFTWWNTQDVQFQQNYALLFSTVMAQEIVAGTAE
jgi:hypothetical protein